MAYIRKRAVYIIVLEKTGYRTLIYCGSDTYSQKGVGGRFKNYDDIERLG